MPRLNHKKARTGCQRCKARKVKCDEGRPRCSACLRHNVSCEYVHAASTNSEQQALPTPPNDIPYNVRHAENDVSSREVDPLLEVRLMHEWTAYTCKTFSTTWEFWCYQAPLIALEFRYVMDAMLAVAALHASKQPPAQWIPLEGRMVEIRNPIYNPAHPERNLTDRWKLHDGDHTTVDDAHTSLADAVSNAGNKAYLASKRSWEMLTISRIYFDRAIDGHRRALASLTVENIEAVYVCSILVSFNALFTLNETEDDPTLPHVDPKQWLRLARGTRYICARWEELVGRAWIASSGVFYGKPDMTDDDTLFNRENGRPFERLLTWAEDFEAITDEDRDTYKKTLSYIGLIYRGIIDGTDSPMATCRRLIAMPSRCPTRFVDLCEAKQPRALTMLAHVFASMKLVDDGAIWFRGIAERQVPNIYEQLPVGWREMMAWPMAVARGEIDREPKETHIDYILSL